MFKCSVNAYIVYIINIKINVIRHTFYKYRLN